jgi:hypothetical protein
MTMTPDQVAELDARAQTVGKQIGWLLRFSVAPNPEYVALTAGPNRVVIKGPDRLSNLAAHDIDITLDQLLSGARRIITDEDGDPRLH